MKIDILNNKDFVKKALFLVCVVLTIAWMMVIFGFSANNAEESTVQSNAVTEIILRIFNSDFDKMTPEEQQTLIDSCDRIVRKLAHFTAYAVLGFLAYFSFRLAPFARYANAYKPAVFSFLLCVVFAATDEYHQTFVSGRAGRFSDILIDSGGVVFGTLFALIVMSVVTKIMIKKQNKRGL